MSLYLTRIIPYILKIIPNDASGEWVSEACTVVRYEVFLCCTTVTIWQSKTSATIIKSVFPKHSTRSGPRHFQSKLGHWATRHRHLLFNFEPQLREETIFVYLTFTQSSFSTFHTIYT